VNFVNATMSVNIGCKRMRVQKVDDSTRPTARLAMLEACDTFTLDKRVSATKSNVENYKWWWGWAHDQRSEQNPVEPRQSLFTSGGGATRKYITTIGVNAGTLSHDADAPFSLSNGVFFLQLSRKDL